MSLEQTDSEETILKPAYLDKPITFCYNNMYSIAVVIVILVLWAMFELIF